MMVLGIDPGIEHTGLALLSLEKVGAGATRVRLEQGQHARTANVLPWLEHELDQAERRGRKRWLDLVAVERPGKPRGSGPRVDLEEAQAEIAKLKGAGASLVETAWFGGLLAGVAASWGLDVRSTTAEDWRLALCSKRSPSNAEVAHALSLFKVEGLSRSNNHVRDAVGIALTLALKPQLGEAIRW